MARVATIGNEAGPSPITPWLSARAETRVGGEDYPRRVAEKV